MPVSVVVRRADTDPVLIVDLDGTLLTINSFPRWAAHLARARFRHLSRRMRLRIAARAIGALTVRKLRLIDHCRLKWRLQRLWLEAADDGGTSESHIRDELLGFVRPQFAPLLAAVRAGTADAILATAAAEAYARGLGSALGFAHVLAAPATAEMPLDIPSGEQKRRAILRFLEARGWEKRPLTVFTDHADDVPVMRLARTVYWFGTAAGQRACAELVHGVAIRPGLDAEHRLTWNPEAIEARHAATARANHWPNSD